LAVQAFPDALKTTERPLGESDSPERPFRRFQSSSRLVARRYLLAAWSDPAVPGPDPGNRSFLLFVTPAHRHSTPTDPNLIVVGLQ